MTKVENKKYELIETAELLMFTKMFRIRALRSFGDVKEGQLGGYVESENNLSHEGNAWIYHYAKVCGNAKVIDNAKIRNRATVLFNAVVSENAEVYDNAVITDDAVVEGDTKVYGDARVGGVSKVTNTSKVHGNANVDGNAFIFGNAEVGEDSTIAGNARVHGDARVMGSSVVLGSAEIYDNALVTDYANVEGSSRIFGSSIVGGQSLVKGTTCICDNAKVIGKILIDEKARIDNMAFLTGEFRVDEESHISSCEDFEIFYVNWGPHSIVSKPITWLKRENKWNVKSLNSEYRHLTDEEFIKFGEDIDEKTGLIFAKYVELRNLKNIIITENKKSYTEEEL